MTAARCRGRTQASKAPTPAVGPLKTSATVAHQTTPATQGETSIQTAKQLTTTPNVPAVTKNQLTLVLVDDTWNCGLANGLRVQRRAQRMLPSAASHQSSWRVR
jgi:hypothetical protein